MNTQFQDCDEKLAEFDKKCTGLELLTMPLSSTASPGTDCMTVNVFK